MNEENIRNPKCQGLFSGIIVFQIKALIIEKDSDSVHLLLRWVFNRLSKSFQMIRIKTETNSNAGSFSVIYCRKFLMILTSVAT